MKSNFIRIFLLFSLTLASCARAPLPTTLDEVMRQTEPVELKDDLPLEPLLLALEQQIQLFSRMRDPQVFQFGPTAVSKAEYLDSLQRLIAVGRADPLAFADYLKNNFDFYEVYGRGDWGEVLLTSYFEPVIPGSLKQTKRFSQPLYAVPDDLLTLNLTDFIPDAKSPRALRARVVGKKVVPYWSRDEIDSHARLQNKKLEIAWVEPIDAFFLQIQGSGTVRLPKGEELYINFAEKNGAPYKAIGSFLKTQIAPEPVTMQNIERYLHTLSPQEMQKILNKNPSYVFFQRGKHRAVTAMGVPATPGRTIATDREFFPKGGLAVLSFEYPVIKEGQIVGSEKVTRLVIDQDVGGAITGPGRVDLFWGRGDPAKEVAGRINTTARLYYLVPKEEKKS